jgi:hypothetical protein
MIAKFLFFVAIALHLHQLGLYAWRTTDPVVCLVEPPNLEMTVFIAVTYLGAVVAHFIKIGPR